MRYKLFAIVVAGWFWFSVPAKAQGAHVNSVDPITVKTDDLVSVIGESIGKANVDALYLTTGTVDVKVAMLEQSETLIKFKLPAGVKPGRWAVMIHLSKGAEPRLLEQPVKVTVE